MACARVLIGTILASWSMAGKVGNAGRLLRSIATLPETTPSQIDSGNPRGLSYTISIPVIGKNGDNNESTGTLVASRRGKKCHVTTVIQNTDDISRPVCTVARCAVYFERDVEAVALVSEKRGRVMLIVTTRGGRLWRSAPGQTVAFARGDVQVHHGNRLRNLKSCPPPFSMVECCCEKKGEDGSVYRSFLLGANILAVRDGVDISINQSPGAMLVVAGSSALVPPKLVYIPYTAGKIDQGRKRSKKENNRTSNLACSHFSVHTENLHGLDRVVSRISYILVVSRNNVDKDVWRGLLMSYSKSTAKRSLAFGAGMEDSIVLFGFENGQVWCAPISISVPTERREDQGPIMKVGEAMPIHQITPSQTITSIFIFPHSHIVCVGSLGALSVLGREKLNDCSVFYSATPGLPQKGVWTSAAPILARVVPSDSSEDDENINICTVTGPQMGFVATCDDGSAHFCTICHHMVPRCQESTDEMSTIRYSSLTIQLPIRKAMASVSTCLISGKLCPSKKSGNKNSSILLFSTYCGSLVFIDAVSKVWDVLLETASSDQDECSISGALQIMIAANKDCHGVPVSTASSASKQVDEFSAVSKMIEQLKQFSDNGVYGNKKHGSLQDISFGTKLSQSLKNVGEDAISVAKTETRNAVSIVASCQKIRSVQTNENNSPTSAPSKIVFVPSNDSHCKNFVTFEASLREKKSLETGVPHSARVYQPWVHSCHVLLSLSASQLPQSLPSHLLDSVCFRSKSCLRAKQVLPVSCGKKCMSEVAYGGTAVTCSRPFSDHRFRDDPLKLRVSLWDRNPVITYASLFTVYDKSIGDDKLFWKHSQEEQNSISMFNESNRDRKRYKYDKSYFPSLDLAIQSHTDTGHYTPPECSMPKRRKLAHSSRGLVLSLCTSQSRNGFCWDILSRLLEEDDSTKVPIPSNDIVDAESMAEFVIHSHQQNQLQGISLRSVFPTDIEDSLIRNHLEYRTSCGKVMSFAQKKPVSLVYSRSTSVMLEPSSSSLRSIFTEKVLTNRKVHQKNLFMSPVAGSNTIAVVAARNHTTVDANISSVKADLISRVAVAVGGSSNNDDLLMHTMFLLRSSILRRVMGYYCNHSRTSISELEAAKVLDSYQNTIKSMKVTKMTAYLKRVVNELLNQCGENSVSTSILQSTVRLYHQLRSLDFAIA